MPVDIYTVTTSLYCYYPHADPGSLPGMLTILSVMTGTNWTPIYYHYCDSFGFSIWYFLLIFITATFGVIQLFLAVLASSYSSYIKEQKLEAKKAQVGSLRHTHDTRMHFSRTHVNRPLANAPRTQKALKEKKKRKLNLGHIRMLTKKESKAGAALQPKKGNICKQLCRWLSGKALKIENVLNSQFIQVGMEPVGKEELTTYLAVYEAAQNAEGVRAKLTAHHRLSNRRCVCAFRWAQMTWS